MCIVRDYYIHFITEQMFAVVVHRVEIMEASTQHSSLLYGMLIVNS